MKPRINIGGRQGRDPEFIQGNSSASKPRAHMPITFEGDEPATPTPWELIGVGARWVLLTFALFCSLLFAADRCGLLF